MKDAVHIHASAGTVAGPEPQATVAPAAAASRAIALWASLVIFILGATVLAGWVFDLLFLSWPLRAYSPMSLASSILFCLFGTALGSHAGVDRRWSRRLAAAIAVVELGVGIWTLVAYLTGIGLPFDAWLGTRQAARGLTQGLNRMSPVSGACFTLLGTALLMESHPRLRGRALPQTLASLGLLIAFVSLVGYIYSIASLVTLADYKPIAPQTALAFVLGFTGLFLAAPRRGVMRTVLSPELGGILARRLLGFAVLLPLVAGGIVSAGLRLGVLTGASVIFFLTATSDLSLIGLLLFNASSINAAETRRRTAQASLAESERAYRTLFELAADPMFLVDRGLDILAANAAASAVLGRPVADLQGSPVTGLTSFCAPEMAGMLEQAFRTGHASFQSCARSADGRDVPLEIHARTVEFRGHTVVLMIARDLSERRSAEKALAEKEALLQQAQKMEAIGRLAGGVAHDFNNLLTVIMGYSELLIGKLPAQHDAQSDAFQIKVCAAKAAALTRQLLAFSRKQPASPRRVDLNAIVSEMNQLLRRLIGEQIGLEIRPGAAQAGIRMDPNQLEQVILNLAVNARDAMPDGGKLTIESRVRHVMADEAPWTPAPPPGDYVELVVQDTGTGIPPEVIPHIFEPFFTTKTEARGTGLGLSTVYGIVTQNGGAIAVQSAPRAGTTMSVVFPLLPGDGDGAPGESRSDGSAAARGDGTVLLIEDDPSVRVYLASMLRGAGYTVLEAEHGDAALVTVRTGSARIDAVVSDVVMPGISGRRLADELTRELPGVRIIFMTGYEGGGSAESASLCGRYEIITKPFTAKDLIDKLGALSGSVATVPRMTGSQ